ARRLRYGVGHRDELEVAWPDFEPSAHLDNGDRRLRSPAVLRELGAQHARGERRRINRRTEPVPQIDHGAEVVLVSMSEDDAFEGAALLLDEAQIRQHHLDAGLVLLSKRKAEIDHQPSTVILGPNAVKVDVEANLTETAKSQEYDLILARPMPGACPPHIRHCSFAPAAAPNVTSP